MNIEQAEDLATRTLAAIDDWASRRKRLDVLVRHEAADRERVASDLDLLLILDGRAGEMPRALFDKVQGYVVTNLRRTAALYGVT